MTWRSRFDQWGAVREWRRRRSKYVTHQRPTYDVYPESAFDPEVKVYLEARDARGRLLREYVYLEGYSLHMLNFRRGAMRGKQYVGEWVWDSMIESMTRLAARLNEEKERHDAK